MLPQTLVYLGCFTKLCKSHSYINLITTHLTYTHFKLFFLLHPSSQILYFAFFLCFCLPGLLRLISVRKRNKENKYFKEGHLLDCMVLAEISAVEAPSPCGERAARRNRYRLFGLKPCRRYDVVGSVETRC